MFQEEEIVYEENQEEDEAETRTSKVVHLGKKRGAGGRTPRRDSGWSSMTGLTFKTNDVTKLGGPLNPPAYSGT